FPRPGREVDGVDVDAADAVAQLDVVADLVERIGPFHGDQRRSLQRSVEVGRRRVPHVDDIALARDQDARRRQAEQHDAGDCGTSDADADTPPAAIIDEDVFTPVGTATETTQQAAVVIGDGDDLVATAPDRGETLGAANLEARIAPAAHPLAFV